MLSRTVTLLGLAGALGLAGCSNDVTDPSAGNPGPVESADVKRGAPAPGDDPIATIAIEGGFTELVGALAYVDQQLDAGLIDLLSNSTDQYTVFAPTDAAFDELYALLTVVLGTEVDEITDVPAPIVRDVLLYHVVEGRRAANSVVPPRRDRTIMSALGETFAVRTDKSIRDGLTGLRDDGTITTPNLTASNGIIHIIDAVLVPPSVVTALTE